MKKIQLTCCPTAYTYYQQKYYTEFFTKSLKYKCDSLKNATETYNKSVNFWNSRKPSTNNIYELKPKTASRYVVCYEAITELTKSYKDLLEHLSNSENDLNSNIPSKK